MARNSGTGTVAAALGGPQARDVIICLPLLSTSSVPGQCVCMMASEGASERTRASYPIGESRPALLVGFDVVDYTVALNGSS